MTEPHRESKTSMVIVCGLLFIVSFLAPLSAEYNKAAEYHYWPDEVRVIAAVLAGCSSGAATLLAFFNQSLIRYRQQNGKDVAPKP